MSLWLTSVMSQPTHAPEPLQLIAADGYRLGALHYAPAGQPKGRLIVAGATGVPQGFYKRFAHYTAAQGMEVWTLDYRGIGLTKPTSLRGFTMNY